MGPPGIPADRAKALQDAFMATMDDPKFLADTKKQKIEIAPIPGPEVAAKAPSDPAHLDDAKRPGVCVPLVSNHRLGDGPAGLFQHELVVECAIE